MSYAKKIEYKIMPSTSFGIIRRCAKCGCKQSFLTKEAIRVNANGNQIDIWLIYGCEKCGQTYNLPIYERIRPHKIPKDEYENFLSNNEETIFRYGTDKNLFIKNRAEIDWKNVKYNIMLLDNDKYDLENDLIEIKLYNPCEIPVKSYKIAAEILQISTSKVRKLMDEGRIMLTMSKDNPGDNNG